MQEIEAMNQAQLDLLHGSIFPMDRHRGGHSLNEQPYRSAVPVGNAHPLGQGTQANSEHRRAAVTLVFFSRLCRFLVPRLVAVTLLALASSSPVFCGEIHDAARDGDLGKVKELLKSNPDLVFSKDDRGFTPLHLAAQKGHKDVAELLLANGADVNAKGNKGYTPLNEAAVYGHKDVAELLLAYKAEVNAKSDDNVTPLHGAADKGFIDVVKLLLANKAEVNAKADYGVTPLHLAAFKGYKDIVELLLANGADVNAKATNNSVTPLQMAEAKGYVDVAELLRQHGGHD